MNQTNSSQETSTNSLLDTLKQFFQEKNYASYVNMLSKLETYEEKKIVMDYFFQKNKDSLYVDYINSQEGVSYQAFFEQITPFIQSQIQSLGSLNTLYSNQDLIYLFIVAYNEKAFDLANALLRDIRQSEGNDQTLFEKILPKLNSDYLNPIQKNKIKQERLNQILVSIVTDWNIDLSTIQLSDVNFQVLMNEKEIPVLNKAIEKGLDLVKHCHSIDTNVLWYMSKNKNPMLASLNLKDDTISALAGVETMKTLGGQREDLNTIFNQYLTILNYASEIKSQYPQHTTQYMKTENIEFLTRMKLTDFVANWDRISLYMTGYGVNQDLIGKIFHQVKYVSYDSWYKSRQAHHTLKPYNDLFYFLVDKAFSYSKDGIYGISINDFYSTALTSYLAQNKDKIQTNPALKQSIVLTYLSRLSDSIAKQSQSLSGIDKNIYVSRLNQIGHVQVLAEENLSHLYRTNKESFNEPLPVEQFNQQGVISHYNKFAQTHGLSTVQYIEPAKGFKKLMNFFNSSKKEGGINLPVETIKNDIIKDPANTYSIDYLKMHELLDHPKMDLEVFLSINELYAKSKIISIYLQEEKVEYIESKLLLKKTFEFYLPQILLNYINSLNIQESEENFKEKTIEQIKLLSEQVNKIEIQVKNSHQTEVVASMSEFGEFLKAKLTQEGSDSDLTQNNIDNTKNTFKMKA